MKTLDSWQIDALRSIGRAGEIGLATHTLMPRYRASLAHAIDAHNQGSAKNSPLPATMRIEARGFGPKGGQGYRAVDARELVVQIAIARLEDEVTP